ncbi:DUF4268 domain-containing protein [Candidatus Poribacteria bacterium]|nr:DUF4268 domain-containing protein [Candidatus Poribacteria bacterium]
MALELEGQEVNVGNFRADMLCRNAVDGSRVLIENQLEETDHSHFGQILTYAVGLDVDAVIWIAKKFREEHRAALDRLNETPSANFQYFGVEIKVWKIGNSTPAPQFEIISKPKDWRHSIRQKIQIPAPEYTPEERLQLERYWRQWTDYMIQKTGKRDLLNFDMDCYGTELHLDAHAIKEKKEISITLYIGGENARKYFRSLKEQEEEIEREFVEPLEWDEDSLHPYERIVLRKTDTDPTDETDWPNQHEWLTSKAELFEQVFGPRLKALNAVDWKSLEDEDEA